MNKSLVFLLVSTLLFLSLPAVFGQSTIPQGFNYQAIARNASGTAIINTDMKVKIGILSDTIANILVWEEEHTVRTNGYGLFTLVVGGPLGTRTGGSATTFNLIDWAATQMFISVQLKNPATAATYTPMGKARLWSVPYALLAGKSQQDLSSPFSENVDTIYTGQNMVIGSNKPLGAQLAVVSEDDASEEPLFEVRRKDGQPVFTVYNDAVTINVPMDGKKGSPSRGGFAVGGFDETKGEHVSDLLRVTPDSVRIYINNNPTLGKGSPSRGGFAVGGFDETKATMTEIFRVTHDSTRLFTGDPEKGFAISETGTATSIKYLMLKPDNYFIGQNAGRKITIGKYNLFIGYEAGQGQIGGSNNLFIGYQSGYQGGSNGSNNTFLGYKSGFRNGAGSKNVFIGDSTGYSNTNGRLNVFIGARAGVSNTTGNYNAFVGYMAGAYNNANSNNLFGYQAGYKNVDGEDNLIMGTRAGYNNTSGSNNVFLGYYAGTTNTTGNENTYIGSETGWGSSAGGSNVMIGSKAGLASPAGNDNVYIGTRSGFGDKENTIVADSNVFIGSNAGYGITYGSYNLFAGAKSGFKNTTGDDNVFLGFKTGANNTTGYSNLAIGSKAGYSTSTGTRNSYLGGQAGNKNTDGTLNVMLGYHSGINNINGDCNTLLGTYTGLNCLGSYNVFIGYAAGYNTNESNRLFIENSSSSSPLIYGEFDNNRVVINGNAGSNPSNYNFYVNGTSGGDYSWNSLSDIKLKTNIITIPSALSKVLRIRGVNFEWKDPESSEKGPRMGFIAQEIEPIVPEVVSKDGEYYTMQYAPMTALLVEAVKEQQKTIEELHERISKLEEIILKLSDK